jgi:hypothetical protein
LAKLDSKENMPVQRSVPPQSQRETAERAKEIQPWQLFALRTLYLRNEATGEFVRRLYQNCSYKAGSNSNISEIAVAISLPIEHTCQMLADLEHTGIGRLVKRIPVLDEDRTFRHFHWIGNFDELVQMLLDDIPGKPRDER